MNIPVIGQSRQAPPKVQCLIQSAGDMVVLQLVYDGLHVHAAPMSIEDGMAFVEAFHAKLDDARQVRGAALAAMAPRLQSA